MPSRSSLLIAGLWALSIWSAIQGAFLMPLPNPAGEMPPVVLATLVLLPVMFFGVVSFWMPSSPFYHPVIARLIDARLGAGTLENFLVRLKPLLMFATAAVCQGAAGLWHSYTTGAPAGTYAVPGFMLSGGVGFALVHFVLYFRRSVGVFPGRTIEAAVVGRGGVGRQRKSLRDALRAYWWTLIGVAVFPTVAILANEILHVGLEYLAIPFFAVCLLAAWPHMAGRAPYTFWLVAMVVWLAGGVSAFVVLGLLARLGVIPS